MFLQFVLLMILIPGVILLSLREIDAEWDLFKVKFNRTYSTRKEEKYRYEVFTENVKEVYLHNIAADNGRYSYWLRLNKFADLSGKEFNDIFANLKIEAGESIHADVLDAKIRTRPKHNLTSIPEAVDWRKKNCVTLVKYQGNCSSCYAFAATGALEGLHCKQTGELLSLLEQNILDCSFRYGNHGCKNGLPDTSFQFAKDQGIDTEQSYPYRGAIGQCEMLKDSFGVMPDGYQKVLPKGNETILKEAVAAQGPVSACIDTKGEGRKFQLYGHGVYDNKECGMARTNLNHAMLIVGYDKTEEGVDYWIIKNSYGTCWGIDGYMKMVRNGKNTCGIATEASYPTMYADKS